MSRFTRIVCLVSLVAALLTAVPAQAAEPPSNDDVSSAIELQALPVTLEVEMSAASREALEPDVGYCDEDPMTVWYRYTPDQDRVLGLLLSTPQDASVAFFTGPGRPLVREACSYLWNRQARTVKLRSGVEYWIQVGTGWSQPLSLMLYEPATLSGTITNENGDPLESICIDVVSGPTYYIWDLSSTDGTYSLTNLAPADYKLAFYDCDTGVYAFEFYNDKATFEQADPVTVASGQHVTGIDAQLAVGGRLKGRAVVPPGSGTVCVHAISDSDYGFSVVNNTGGYSMRGLRSGDYKVRFEGCNGGRARIEWYKDKTTVESADPVSVVAGQETVLDDVELDVYQVPANDRFAAATPITAFPFSDEVEMFAATDERTPVSSCSSSSWRRDVWYSVQVSQPSTIVAALSGSTSNHVLSVWSVGPSGALIEETCMSGSSSKGSDAALRAMPGTTYYIQASTYNYFYYPQGGSLRLDVDLTAGTEEVTLEAPVPCSIVCPYWNQTMTATEEYEASCAPSPDSPPGSWADIEVTVPGSVDGRIPTHLAFTLEPGVDWDSFLCRKQPDASGRYFVRHDANPMGAPCPVAGIAGCIEAVSTRVTPGEAFVLRAYNWSDVSSVKASYSYKLAP